VELKKQGDSASDTVGQRRSYGWVSLANLENQLVAEEETGFLRRLVTFIVAHECHTSVYLLSLFPCCNLTYCKNLRPELSLLLGFLSRVHPPMPPPLLLAWPLQLPSLLSTDVASSAGYVAVCHLYVLVDLHACRVGSQRQSQ